MEYRDARCITPALEMMNKTSDYCFVMENMLNLMEYNAASLLNASPAAAAKSISEKLAQWSEYYQKRKIAPQFPLLHSVDFSQPADFSGLINFWNEKHKASDGRFSSRTHYSSAKQFFDAVSKGSPLFDQVMGERPNLWLYIHGPTHHWAISAQREAEILLPAAEIFSTIQSLVAGSFKNYPSGKLQEAWMAAIYSDHGWGGKEGDHHYKFSIFSHAPGWKNGYRSGIQANNPLMAVVRPASDIDAALPEEKSFFSVSAGNVLVSTIKKCADDDSVTIRCYDIEGKDTDVQLNFFFPVGKAELINIIEEEGRSLPAPKNNLQLKVGHHPIETLKLWPQHSGCDE